MSDVCIDINDYKTILTHKGKIDGFVGGCKKTKFINVLKESLSDSLSKAKGILIQFELNKSTNLFVLNDFMGEINDLISKDCEIIFSTIENKNIEDEYIGYQIIMSGVNYGTI